MAARNAPPRGYVIYDGPSMLDGSPIVAIATLESTNRKTGNMVQTWILCRDIDPIGANRIGADVAICGNCPQKGTPRPATDTSGLALNRGCYVDLGRAPSGIFDAFSRGMYPRAEGHKAIAAIGRGRKYRRKVRLGAYGDPAAVPGYIWESLLSECAGWTGYTHQSDWAGAAVDVSRMMVSADSLAGAESAWSQGARTFRVVGQVSELVRGREILCPASAEAGHRTQCADCMLCGGAAVKAKSIAIVVHGAGSKHHSAAAA